MTISGEGGNGWGVRYSSPSHVMRLRHPAYIVNFYNEPKLCIYSCFFFVFFLSCFLCSLLMDNDIVCTDW